MLKIGDEWSGHLEYFGIRHSIKVGFQAKYACINFFDYSKKSGKELSS